MKTITAQQRELIQDIGAEGLTSLPAGVLEKDIHLTEALRYLSSANTSDIQLVFCGGTCLSKAHGIIERMSEDLDFKIIIPKDLAGSAKRKLLGKFKDSLIEGFSSLGFSVPKKEVIAGDGNSSMLFNLHYESQFPQVVSLRPEIKVEMHARTPLLECQPLEIRSIADEVLALKDSQFSIFCINAPETLAEKVLSFLRRTAQSLEIETKKEFDERLIRHIYDVLLIYRKQPHLLDDLPKGLFDQMIQADGLQYQNQYPQFLDDPKKRLLMALDNFSESAEAEKSYQRFVAELVYGEPVSFEEARLIFIQLAKNLLN